MSQVGYLKSVLVKLFLFTVFLFLSLNAHAVDFKHIFDMHKDDADGSVLQKKINEDYHLYKLRQEIKVLNSLSVDDAHVISIYVDSPDSFDIGGIDPEEAKELNEKLRQSLKKIKIHGVSEAYSGRLIETNGTEVKVGEYVVNIDKPLSFTDDPKVAVQFAKKKIISAIDDGGRVAIFRVESKRGKPVSAYSDLKEAEVLYPKDSIFLVLDRNTYPVEYENNKTIDVTELRLKEVDYIPEGKVAYDYRGGTILDGETVDKLNMLSCY